MLTIRLAKQQDAHAMFMVHQAAVYGLCAKSYSPEHMEHWFQGRTPDVYSPAIGDGHVWVSELNGSVVGFVGATRGEVTLLFVLPQHIGQGIGSALLQHGLAYARIDSQDPVEVLATKNSESFYAAHGFVAIEERWFEREGKSLRYPVVKMLLQGNSHRVAQIADA